MSGEQGLIWAGSVALTQTTLKRTSVRFEDGATHSNTVEISYAPRIQTVKILNAIEPTAQNGFYTELTSRASSWQYFRGKDGGDIAMFTPQVVPSNWVPLIFCPRKLETRVDEKKKETVHAVAGNFKPVSVTTPITGMAKGSYRSGSATAHARAEIFTTSNLAPSKPNVDEMEEVNPEADVEYLPSTDGWNADTAPKVLESGIRAQVRLTAPGGQTRTGFSESAVYVREVPLTKPVTVPVGVKPAIVEPGACFAIVRHQGKGEIYR